MLGEKLFELRKSKNKTQVDMAKILGVAKTTYASYEQNRRTPDNSMQIKIADYFNISLDELNGRELKTDHFEEADAIMFKDIEGFNDLPPEKQQEIKDMINRQLKFFIEEEKRDS